MKNWILRKTHHLWNSRISAILCRCYQEGDITSQQLHILTSKFDPTQEHQVY